MLLLVSVTLLGASVSANLSNVVTPEGSELPDPSVGHEFKATYAANFVHDLQQLMLDGYSSHCCCYGRGDVLALPAYHNVAPLLASTWPSLLPLTD